MTYSVERDVEAMERATKALYDDLELHGAGDIELMVWSIVNVEVSTANPDHDAMLPETAVALGLPADTDRYTVSEELSRRFAAYYDEAYDWLALALERLGWREVDL